MKNFNTKLAFNTGRKLYSESELVPALRTKNGAMMPNDTLSYVLYQIKRYNMGQEEEVREELSHSIPTLVDLGLFDLFPPEDWINSDNAGRRFVGETAQEYMEDQALSFALAFI